MAATKMQILSGDEEKEVIEKLKERLSEIAEITYNRNLEKVIATAIEDNTIEGTLNVKTGKFEPAK